MKEFKRYEGETEQNYIYRICEAKEQIGTWVDVGNVLNENLGYDFTESAYRKQYQMFKKMLEAREEIILDDQQHLDELRIEREKLTKERVKLSDEKAEYRRWLREDAREEEFRDRIVKVIEEKLGKGNKPVALPPKSGGDKTGVLAIADMHFGKEFKLYDIYNNIINQYSPEIFYDRMNKLLGEVKEVIAKEKLDKIIILNLGDSLDGFLRHSQIWSLRAGVVDSAIEFGDFMAQWLKTLSEVVRVEYHQTNGNHGELRLLDGKKGTHEHENIEKITCHLIKAYNKNNPNLEIIENKSGKIFTKIAGYNVLGIHGEAKDGVSAIKEYSDIYETPIHYLFMGHHHHGTYVNSGVKKGVIGVGSIVGIDDFSLKLRKAAEASASLIIFREGKGKAIDYTFTLN